MNIRDEMLELTKKMYRIVLDISSLGVGEYGKKAQLENEYEELSYELDKLIIYNVKN